MLWPKATVSMEAGRNEADHDRSLRGGRANPTTSDHRSGRDESDEELLDAVAWAAWWFNDPDLATRSVVARRRGPNPGGRGPDVTSDRARLATLSPREIEVLGLIIEGLGDKVIARRLHISGHTVHRHVSNILTKLDVTSRAGAAALGARHGLSPPRL
jgi:DNA-binding NarL/FixJ family response regulator